MIYFTPVLSGLFALAGSLDNLPLLILTIVSCIYVRVLSFRNMFVRNMYTIWDVVNSVSSHLLLFSSLYIIFGTEYTKEEPVGDFIDSLYYSMDTLTTNGAGRIVPNTGRTIMIHILNLIDTYLLFVTIGFYIVQVVRSSPKILQENVV